MCTRKLIKRKFQKIRNRGLSFWDCVVIRCSFVDSYKSVLPVIPAMKFFHAYQRDAPQHKPICNASSHRFIGQHREQHGFLGIAVNAEFFMGNILNSGSFSRKYLMINGL